MADKVPVKRFKEINGEKVEVISPPREGEATKERMALTLEEKVEELERKQELLEQYIQLEGNLVKFRANIAIPGVVSVGETQIIWGGVNPATGSGVEAPIGSLYLSTDVSLSSNAFSKHSTGDTDWNQLN